MSTIFVTGANGYLGSWISRGLAERGYGVIAGSREPLAANTRTNCLENRTYGDLRYKTDWKKHLVGVEVLVHAAGFAHMKEPLSESDRENAQVINEYLVRDLAETAIEVGVKHIVLISTIAVHGSGSFDSSVDELTPLLPETTYARTKLSGEKQLIQCCENSATSWTIVRPAMVYGPDCPGNFPDLVHAVRARIPLPFKNVQNSRSLIYIENLVDLVALCVHKPEARNEIFVAADAAPASISQIIPWIAEASGKKPTMLSFPVPLMRGLARLLGMQSRLSSLVDDFVVDGRKAKNSLGWRPSFDTRSGILRSVSRS